MVVHHRPVDWWAGGGLVGDRRPRGQLEATVKRILWEAEVPLSAREILARFDADDSGTAPAFTTLLTVLERLRAKGQAVRTAAADGTARFSAAQSEPSFIAAAMLTALTDSSDRGAALLQFAGNLHTDDAEILRRALGGGSLGGASPAGAQAEDGDTR
ncbi:BlaI/MecI/CopY family transcriptional regulator [Sinomonas soli]